MTTDHRQRTILECSIPCDRIIVNRMIHFRSRLMILDSKKACSLERSFLIPVSICLLVVSFGCLAVTVRSGIHFPIANWPAEAEADQFEVLRRVEASGLFILMLALVRKAFLRTESNLLIIVQNVLHSIGTLFQICCATLGITNGGIYLLNLALQHTAISHDPVLPFPILPLAILGAGFYVTLAPAMSDAEPE